MGARRGRKHPYGQDSGNKALEMNAYATKVRIGLSGLLFLWGVRGCPGASFVLANTNLITINDSQAPPTKATPYASTNVVSGLAGMVVTKVTLTLDGFSHAFPSDVAILVAGPQGQEAIVMAQAGGQMQFSVTNLTLTLDDGAARALPIYTRLETGTFKPTNGYLALGYPRFPYDFPPPAPPGNSNALSALSVFNGTAPDGAWRLFVVDDAGGGAGNISRGWSLNLSAGIPLTISRAQTQVVISWTNAVSGCTLQSAPSPSGVWTNAMPAPVVISGRYTVTNGIGPGSTYYRLIK
jgi:hypothetical protein